MSFRSAPGHILRWENTDLPAFSNFAFCEAYYRAHSVLRRVLSLARKLGYRSILCEEIRANECALLEAEDAALAIRRQDFSGSTVHRLTFFRSPAETPPQAHEFLGYAVFKLDQFGPNDCRAHVYESVLRPVRPAEGIASYIRSAISTLLHQQAQAAFEVFFMRSKTISPSCARMSLFGRCCRVSSQMEMSHTPT